MTTTPHTATDYAFAPIPELLLFDNDLSHLAVRIYGVLMRHGLSPSSCYPSHARIAQLANCSKRSVAEPLRILETKGWIVRIHRTAENGEPMSNAYHIRTTPNPAQIDTKTGSQTPQPDPITPVPSNVGPVPLSVDLHATERVRTRSRTRLTIANERKPLKDTGADAPQSTDNVTTQIEPVDWAPLPAKRRKAAQRGLTEPEIDDIVGYVNLETLTNKQAETKFANLVRWRLENRERTTPRPTALHDRLQNWATQPDPDAAA